MRFILYKATLSLATDSYLNRKVGMKLVTNNQFTNRL